MSTTKALIGRGAVSAAFAVAVWLYLMPATLQGQQNGVYNSGNTVVGSTAFIDAAVYCVGTSGGSSNCYLPYSSTYPQYNIFDFCNALKGALIEAVALGGGVVDARGVVPPPGEPNGGGGYQLCYEDPFAAAGISPTSNSTPITVLLPASTILMCPPNGNWNGGWVLPNNVRISGQGESTGLFVGYSSGKPTRPCPAAPSYSSNYIIQMGPASKCVQGSNSVPCSGISVEHLTLGGPDCSGYSYFGAKGIVNNWAQDASYVNDVKLCDLSLTGLYISPTAIDSGPYTNINSTSGNSNGSSCSNGLSNSCPACIDIEAQTRGVHGATCIGGLNVSGSAGDAGIYVNASNNSISDVHFEGFYDGIEVGDTSAYVGNVTISNINGGTSAGNGPVTNVVHICGPNNNQPTLNPCATYGTGTVTDVSILGISARSGPCTTAVQDDVTGSSIAAATLGYNVSSTLPLGIYILGEESGGTTQSPQYSRFSTSPSVSTKETCSVGETQTTFVPSWGVGNTAPLSTCDTPGALYSYTGGGSGSSIWVCTINGTWADII
jgi:hypothetical protein